MVWPFEWPFEWLSEIMREVPVINVNIFLLSFQIANSKERGML